MKDLNNLNDLTKRQLTFNETRILTDNLERIQTEKELRDLARRAPFSLSRAIISGVLAIVILYILKLILGSGILNF